MEQKIQTATFQYRKTESTDYQYLCIKVTDSLAFNPGSRYSVEDVQKLCDSERWKVTIVNA